MQITLLQLFAELRTAQAILTHLSHTIDAAVFRKPGSLPASVSLTCDGLSVELPDA